MSATNDASSHESLLVPVPGALSAGRGEGARDDPTANGVVSGDFLARLGLTWSPTKTYDQYGTITAQFNGKKTGTGGGYSYIGIYGWSVSPCVEFYIVDDSYNRLPVNPGSTVNKGSAMIDGGTYTLYTRQTTGTATAKRNPERPCVRDTDAVVETSSVAAEKNTRHATLHGRGPMA